MCQGHLCDRRGGRVGFGFFVQRGFGGKIVLVGKTVHAFCPVCGDNVRCNEVIEGKMKKVVCNNCSYLVSEKKYNPSTTERSIPKGKPFERIINAEDTATIRESLASTIREAKIARDVLSVNNGFEFLVAYQKAVDDGTRVDLVILDVEMPVLDGINAAIAMRAVEKGCGRRRTPILFFTSNAMDDTFIRALRYLAPARHMQKGETMQGLQFANDLVKAIGDWRLPAS